MLIHTGIQSNCSEGVEQICGVHVDNVKEFKCRVKNKLKYKYSTNYLDKYMSKLCKIDANGKYCLTLYEFDGTDTDWEDWNHLKEVAKEMDIHVGIVSCCSTAIDNDKHMEEYIEWKLKQKN